MSKDELQRLYRQIRCFSDDAKARGFEELVIAYNWWAISVGDDLLVMMTKDLTKELSDERQ